MIDRFRITLTGLLCIGLLLSATGCLRSRFLSEENGFRDSPALPRQNFGRPGEHHPQAGVDSRTREIESSLGIEGRPPRIFAR